MAWLPLPVLVLLSVALLVLVNGAWHTPSVGFLTAYARDVFDPPSLGDQAYAVFSPLGPLLAWVTGLTENTSQYTILHATAGGAALAVVVGAARAWYGDETSRCITVAFAASATGVTLLHWLGLPDPFVFLAGSIAALGPATGLLGGMGALLGFGHFEQGAVIVVALAALSWADGWKRLTKCQAAALAVGVVVGRLLLFVYHSVFGIETPTDRLDYAQDVGLDVLTRSWWHGGVWLLASLYAAWWLVIVYVGAAMLSRARRLAITFLLVNVALVAATIVTRDQTRVFAMVSWPVVTWALLWGIENLSTHTLRRVIAVSFVLAVVLPYRFDFFDGRDRGSYRAELSDWMFG